MMWAVRVSTTCLAMALSLSPVASRQLTAIRVSEGDDLQTAIDAARPGDTILLARGARFVGNYVLRARPADSQAFITIRTDAPGLPAAGERISPRASGTLAVLQSPSNAPALRTAAGAHHWRLEALEFGPNRRGDGTIIDIGSGDNAAADRVPHTIVLDRLYVHGDPFAGQKRGLALNGGRIELRNSYVADIKGVGQDTQAVASWNGPGPFVIENNYLEAAGENILFGGADPKIENLVPRDITIRGNHIARPVAWRSPIVSAPDGVQARAGAGGTLPAAEYRYTVVAERPVSGGATAVSAAAETSIAVREPGTVSLTWQPVAGATRYRVIRTGGETAVSWRVEATTFADAGQPGQAGGSVPKPTVWTVKNLLELKNAADVVIDGNLFEYHWAGAQSGYAVLFTPRNQDGRSPWSRVENVRFVNNVVRHVAAVFNILGVDNAHPSGPAQNITIENNVFLDVSRKAWGGNGDFLQMGAGARDVRVERNTIDHTGRAVYAYGKSPFPGFVFRGNVLRHNAYGVIGEGASPGVATLEKFFPQSVFEQNLISGSTRARYPGGNRFVGDDDMAALVAGVADGKSVAAAAAGADPARMTMALRSANAGTANAGTANRGSTSRPSPSRTP